MPKCHICKRKFEGMKCSCGQEYIKKNGKLYRKNVHGRWLESLGKDDFKPKLTKDW